MSKTPVQINWVETATHAIQVTHSNTTGRAVIHDGAGHVLTLDKCLAWIRKLAIYAEDAPLREDTQR